MNKKILIGSIVIVTVLIGVSFTSVVSYGSVKSTSILNSPLFNMRSQRAIGQGQQEITTDYLGHGEKANLHLSDRTKRPEQVQKAIDIISKMDDRAFNKFFTRVILHLKYQKKMTTTEIIDVLKELQHVRRNPNIMDYYDTMNIPIYDTSEFVSCRRLPVCYIIDILLYIWEVISSIIPGWITSLGGHTNCPTMCCPL